MRIWVDADACPAVIREIIFKAAYRLTIYTVFVANKPIFVPPAPHVSTVTVEAGPDKVDDYIVEQAQVGDLVITQDIPLAARLVSRGIASISPYGTLFDAHNMGERLSVRNFATDMRDVGVITRGPKPFGEKDKRQFANAFDQLLTRLRRAQSTE